MVKINNEVTFFLRENLMVMKIQVVFKIELSKAVVQRRCVKKMFLEILQNSQ